MGNLLFLGVSFLAGFLLGGHVINAARDLAGKGLGVGSAALDTAKHAVEKHLDAIK